MRRGGSPLYSQAMTNALLIADPAAQGTARPRALPGVRLESLLRADIPAVGAAYCAAHEGTDAQMTLAEATADIEASWAGEYGSLIPKATLGAWRGSELLGAILTVRDAPWEDAPPGPFIIDLFVVPAERRNGIGRALVQAVLEDSTEPVALRVEEDNTPAVGLYRGLGFAPAP